MKKFYFLTAILAGTLACSISYSDEVSQHAVAATGDYSATPSTATAVPKTAADDPATSMMTARILSSFRDSLKMNNAAGACVVTSPMGNTLASYSDMSDTFSKGKAMAAPALDKRMMSANNKAFTSSMFGANTANISDKEIAMHNASMQTSAMTNLSGGMVLKNANGDPVATIGVTAVNANGQDVSAKVAADVAQQFADANRSNMMDANRSNTMGKK